MKISSSAYVLIFFMGFAASGARVPGWVKEKIVQDLKPLSKKSDALLVYCNQEISTKEGLLVIKTKEIYQITRSAGTSYGSLTFFLNKDSKTAGLKGWRFTSEGKVLEKVKRNDAVKMAFNASFYDDGKQVYFGFDHVEKGDWIAFEYTLYLSCFFNDAVLGFGNVIDVLEKNVSVSEDINTVLLNDTENVINGESKTFSLRNWIAPRPEEGGPNSQSLVPSLGLTWDTEYHGSWVDFGDKYNELTQNLTTFSGETDSELNRIFALSDRTAQIQEICEYVQQGINYVDIALGKGGFIPRPCNFVHEKKYGDCKDMAFYAISIFNKIGLRAYPVLARSSSSGVVWPGFVGNQFNHAIAALELPKEAQSLQNVLLDGKSYLCVDLTDPNTPTPLLPEGLEGTYGLIIHKERSQLFQFQYAEPSDNKVVYELKLHLDRDQTMHVQLTETETGHYFSKTVTFLNLVAKEKKKEQLEKYIGKMVPGATLESFEVIRSKGSILSIYSFFLPRYGIDSPDGLLVMPNLIDLSKGGFKKRSRRQELHLHPLREKNIFIELTWDNYWNVNSVPKSIKVDSAYFTGTFEVFSTPEAIRIKKKNCWPTPVVPVAEYKKFRKLYRSFKRSFSSPVIFQPK